MRETKYKCSRCGATLDVCDRQSGLSFIKDMGYGSKFDGEKIEISLCCDCTDFIIEICKINQTKNKQQI